MRVPKLRRVGDTTVGPPFSVQVKWRLASPCSIDQAMVTRPIGTERAPNLVVLVQSSFRVIASEITAPELIRISGPSMEMRPIPLSKGSVALLTVLARLALAHW